MYVLTEAGKNASLISSSSQDHLHAWARISALPTLVISPVGELGTLEVEMLIQNVYM